jgi:hypothetical protein
LVPPTHRPPPRPSTPSLENHVAFFGRHGYARELWQVLTGHMLGVGGATRGDTSGSTQSASGGGSVRWAHAVDDAGLDAHVSAVPSAVVTVVFFHAYWCPFSAGVFPLVAMIAADFSTVSVRSVDA